MNRGYVLAGEVHRTPRVGGGDEVGSCSTNGRNLAIGDVGGQLRLHKRVGPAGATTQTVVVEFDELTDMGGQHCAGRDMFPLYVTQMAWVLHRHDRIHRGWRRERVEVTGQPFLNVEYSSAEAFGFGRLEKFAVALHGRATPRGVDEYRTVVLAESRDRGFGALHGIVVQVRVGLKGATAWGQIGGGSYGEPRGLDDLLAGDVDWPLPNVHHAPGEQVDIGSR